jgi:hypothetical protein
MRRRRFGVSRCSDRLGGDEVSMLYSFRNELVCGTTKASSRVGQRYAARVCGRIVVRGEHGAPLPLEPTRVTLVPGVRNEFVCGHRERVFAPAHRCGTRVRKHVRAKRTRDPAPAGARIRSQRTRDPAGVTRSGNFGTNTILIHLIALRSTRADRLRNDCSASHKGPPRGRSAESSSHLERGSAQQSGSSLSARCGIRAPRRRQAPATLASIANPIRPLLA